MALENVAGGGRCRSGSRGGLASLEFEALEVEGGGWSDVGRLVLPIVRWRRSMGCKHASLVFGEIKVEIL